MNLSISTRHSIVTQLPSPRNKNRAQFLWNVGAFDTGDVRRFNSLELQKNPTVYRPYSGIGALAAIKRLLLQFEQGIESGRPYALLSENEVRIVEMFEYDKIGMFQDSTKVLIEALNYDKSWERTNLAKRAERMQLVAESLHRPSTCVRGKDTASQRLGLIFIRAPHNRMVT